MDQKVAKVPTTSRHKPRTVPEVLPTQQLLSLKETMQQYKSANASIHLSPIHVGGVEHVEIARAGTKVAFGATLAWLLGIGLQLLAVTRSSLAVANCGLSMPVTAIMTFLIEKHYRRQSI